MSEALKELGEHVAARRPHAVAGWSVAQGELTVEVATGQVVALAEFLRMDSSCRFSTLVDITAIDWPGRERRFDVVYHLLSMYQNQRIRLRLAVGEEEMVPSVTDVHPSANWFEREVFDMFGIRFRGHPDLRRILLWKDYPGHPLRKDYPLRGRGERELHQVMTREGA
jgi:NADH-quinone oxidoreductase subunit C